MNDHVISQGYSYYSSRAKTRVGGTGYETLSHVYYATLDDSLFDRQSRVSVMNIKLSYQVLLGVLLSCHMYAGGKCHTIYINDNNDNEDTNDYFTPSACARGNCRRLKA